MKKSKLGIFLLSSSLIFAGLSLGMVSCDSGTTNPELSLSISSSTIYVGETATITVTSEGSTVTDDLLFSVEEGATVVDVSDDGIVTGLAAGTATIKARKAGYSAGTVSVTVLENASGSTGTGGGSTTTNPDVPTEEPDAVLEFELGELIGTFSSYGSEVDNPIEDEVSASNGQSVGYVAEGNGVSIDFTATSSGTVDLGLVLAPTALDWSTWEISDVTLSEVIEVTLNDTVLDLSGLTLEGNADWNYFDWQTCMVSDVDIEAGENNITLMCTGSQGPNLDCINVYGDLGITQVVSE